MSEDSSIGEVVKEETTRQSIALIFSVAGTIAMVYIMRRMSSPDIYKTLRMATALKVKRFAEGQVTFWENVREQAAERYRKERY